MSATVAISTPTAATTAFADAPHRQLLVRFQDRTHAIAFASDAIREIAQRTGWPAHLLEVTHVSDPFCTVRVKSGVRGGKGGFGTLLKGQSRQAGANLTTDFGACRDLQGRRLRHVNDEIKLRRWRERQRKEKNGIKVDEEDLWKTPSGIYNWHLMVPTWADISNKATSRIKRQFQQIQKEEDARNQRKKDKERVYQDSVTHYADQAKTASTSMQTSLKDAIRQGLDSKKRKRLDADANGNGKDGVDRSDYPAVQDTDQPDSLVTLSGDVVVLDDGEQKATASPASILNVQSKSEFGTAALVLDKQIPNNVTLYYEVKLITGGLAQIGWASLLGGPSTTAATTSASGVDASSSSSSSDAGKGRFSPNDETGDGVGDDAASYGFDPCRQLKFHAGSEEAYGAQLKNPAKPGDVLGCYYSISDGTISFAVNGKHLGTAFTVDDGTKTSTKKEQQQRQGAQILFPAFSCNQEVALEVRTTQKDCKYCKSGKGAKMVKAVGEFLAITTPSDKKAEEASVSSATPPPQEGTNKKARAETTTEVKAEAKPELLDLDEIDSVAQLEALGLDRLKSALLALRVKCGGSLTERAERLFSLKGLQRKDYPQKVRAKNFFL